MKRISWIFFLIIGLAISFTACEDDDEPSAESPSISSITPNTGAPGTAITIAGSNFGTSPTVSFGSTPATVSSSTSTSINTSVPTGLAAGVVNVTVTANGMTSSAASFTVEDGTPTGPITITDDDLTTEEYDWTSDNEYLVDGLVFLEEGGVLNIEEGTIIRFKEDPSNEDDNTSSLIITRGATINAEGTADAPIIFTGESDVEGAVLDPIADNAQWGGLVILGKAPVSFEGASEAQVEGIDSEEPRGIYGGSEEADDSGILKYVSIRYTGVGLGAGNEIQGLTLGGVGNGTTIEYIDIYSSSDDGVEIFGGTVNLKYVSAAFVTDDAFDFDLGWRGTGQFLFGIAASGDDQYDHLGEWDGADPDDATLFAAPTLSNMTLIGPGQEASLQRAVIMRDAFAGKLVNSILEDFPIRGIQIEDRANGPDSYARITTAADGYQVEVMNNTWAQFGAWDEALGIASLVDTTIVEDEDTGVIEEVGEVADAIAELEDNNNVYSADPVLTSISRTTDGGLDPRPAAADTNPVTPTFPAGLVEVTFQGAFDPGQSIWLSGWSTLSKLGYLSE